MGKNTNEFKAFKDLQGGKLKPANATARPNRGTSAKDAASAAAIRKTARQSGVIKKR